MHLPRSTDTDSEFLAKIQGTYDPKENEPGRKPSGWWMRQARLAAEKVNKTKQEKGKENDKE